MSGWAPDRDGRALSQVGRFAIPEWGCPGGGGSAPSGPLPASRRA